MLTALLIDGDKNSRELLHSLIENFTDGIDIIGEASHLKSSILLIQDLNPDVLFLDIELSDGRAFELLDQLDTSPKIVFSSTSEHFAIKAIRYSAFDYLLKPINVEELEKTVDRLKALPPMAKENLEFLSEKLNPNEENENKIIVPSYSGYKLLDIDKIIAIEADANYVFFMLENGEKHIAAHSLNYYEDLLPPNKFYRIHKSHIINFTKVKSVEAGRTGKAILNNGAEMDIAARRKTAFLSYLKKYTSYPTQ